MESLRTHIIELRIKILEANSLFSFLLMFSFTLSHRKQGLMKLGEDTTKRRL